MNSKTSYLQLIQNIISRLANNSFLIKGWTITLVAALYAIIGKDLALHKKYALLGLIPILFFWLLDGYYLSCERKFKNLYNHARILEETKIDFSLITDPYEDLKTKWISCIFSKTLNIFYISLSTTIVLIYFFL